MTEYTQTWKITYPDKPCDLVYDRSSALQRMEAGAPGTTMVARTIVRYDDGHREYLLGAERTLG